MYKLIQHPLFWLFFAGFCAGAVIALLTVRPESRADPRKFRARRPAKIYLLLTGAVACLTIGLFASAPGGIPLRFLSSPFAGVLSGGLGLRFKKAAGIPLLALGIAAAAAGTAALSGWNVADPRAAAASVIVLSLDESGASLSVSADGADAHKRDQIVRVPAAGLRVKTEFLVFPPPYLVFRAIPLYRFVAILASDGEHPLETAGPSAWEQKLLALPGVRIETVETELPNPRLFSLYALTIDPQGAVLVSEKPDYRARAGVQ
ncbi:MAG: hypothetical protein LBQ57_07950 [Spirochaetales bacterium]|nr:hypothetical protein [Spirochaetales bacterium]